VLATYVAPDRFVWASDRIQDTSTTSLYVTELRQSVLRERLNPRFTSGPHFGVVPWSVVDALGSDRANQAPAAARPAAIDSVAPLAAFFEGAWHCRGGTPAGRTLEADVTFTSALGAHWMRSEHVDVTPGRYQSTSFWPTTASSSGLATVIYDNFGGARRFLGSWGTDSIVWTRDTTEAGARLETFTYRRTSPRSYWYAWHVRRTDGAPVTLGDSATCRRSP